MRQRVCGGVVAAVLSIALGLALARPVLADDTNAGAQCRAIRHGADEFAVCLYLDAPDFDDLPALSPEDARSALDAFLAAPDDAACVKTAAGELPFVECYFRRDVFEADEGNPAWMTMGPESGIAQAVLYSPKQMKPLDSSEPMPVVLPEAAPNQVPAMTSPQPAEIPSPEPSPSPSDPAE